MESELLDVKEEVPTVKTLPCQRLAWGLGLGAGSPASVPFCSQPPHASALSSEQRKGQTLAGGGERPGKLAEVCFGLILAFLFLLGLGPQIWHFLFGLGQRSAALRHWPRGRPPLSQLSQPSSQSGCLPSSPSSSSSVSP